MEIASAANGEQKWVDTARIEVWRQFEGRRIGGNTRYGVMRWVVGLYNVRVDYNLNDGKQL